MTNERRYRLLSLGFWAILAVTALLLLGYVVGIVIEGQAAGQNALGNALILVIGIAAAVYVRRARGRTPID